MLVNVEREMSDLLPMLLELQKFCLPQTFEKIILYISFSKKPEIKYIFSSVQKLIIAFCLYMPINSCQSLVNRNQVEEKQQFM